MIIFIGRLIYLLIWIFLVWNLFAPYPAPANFIANIALAAFVITHGLQAWLLSSTLTQQEKQRDRFRVLRLFLFGIFEVLSWKKSKNQQ